MKKGTTEIYKTPEGKIYKVFYHADNVTIIKPNGVKEDPISLSAFLSKISTCKWKIQNETKCGGSYDGRI